jgi:hypothetical protein
MMLSPTYVPPTVTTQGVHFMEAGKPIVLRGIDLPWNNVPNVMTMVGGNFARVRVNWADMEPTAGSYDETNLEKLDATVDELAQHNIQVLIDFHFLKDQPPPAWAALPGDWWTNPASQTEYFPFVMMMVQRYQADANVMGFELWNEPQGAPSTAAGTAEVIKWQAALIKQIRTIEPQRALVVMLRGGWDQGLRQANLALFGPAKQLVLDFHDQFCGCPTGGAADGYTADGENLTEPSSEMVNSNFSTYSGTQARQLAHLNYVTRWQTVLKRPVLVGEFEIHQDVLPTATVFQQQITDLLAKKGYSWARWQGPGDYSLQTPDWGPLNLLGTQLQTILGGPIP